MRSKFLVILGVTLFVLLIIACQTETTTNNRTIDIRTLELVDSSSKCDSIVTKEYLIRGSKIKAFPWA